MFCHYNALEDKLTSFPGITSMMENIKVIYQRNISPNETKNITLQTFLSDITHPEKSKLALYTFFEDLLSHPHVMLGLGDRHYIGIPEHNIDWKSALDINYNKKFIDTVTKDCFILIRHIYIQEDKKSKNAKKGKSQSMFMYVSADMYPLKYGKGIEVIERINHLNFIDSLIAEYVL